MLEVSSLTFQFLQGLCEFCLQSVDHSDYNMIHSFIFIHLFFILDRCYTVQTKKS